MGVLFLFVQPLMGVILPQQFIHTTEPLNRYETQIQVGEIVYIADDTCKHTEVGKSYPVEIDGRKLKVFVGDNPSKGSRSWCSRLITTVNLSLCSQAP